MAHSHGLKGKLESIGKSTFIACYNVFAENYNKVDKTPIIEAVKAYGLARNGKEYSYNSVKIKVDMGCAIFDSGEQEEAKLLCKGSIEENKECAQVYNASSEEIVSLASDEQTKDVIESEEDEKFNINDMEQCNSKILSICEKTIKAMTQISDDADNEIKNSSSYSSISAVQRMQIQKKEMLAITRRYPIYASVEIRNSQGEIKTIYFTTGFVPYSEVYRNCIANKRAPMANLLSQDIDDFYEVNGNEYEILGKAEFSPVYRQSDFGKFDGKGLLYLSPKYSRDIKSLLDYLLNTDDVQYKSDNKGKIKRSIITNMSLRNKPILDKIQNEIYRYNPNTSLVLFGSPGTGKSTTLVKKLGLNLDDDYSELEKTSRDWYMFTPTKLLHEYLKEAFNRENIPASEEHLMVWRDFSKKVCRDTLNILSTTVHKGFIISDAKGSGINDNIYSDQIGWYKDLKIWQDKLFMQQIKDIVKDLLPYLDETQKNLSLFTSILDQNKSIDICNTIDRLVPDIDSLIFQSKQQLGIARTEAYRMVRNLSEEEKTQLYRKLNTIYNQNDEIDEEEELDIDITKARDIIEALAESIKALSKNWVKNKKLSQNTRLYNVNEIIDFNNIVDDEQKREIGLNQVKLDLLRKLRNSKISYYSQLSSRYKKYKKNNTYWYSDNKNLNKISDVEMDALLLLHMEVDAWLKLNRLDKLKKNQVFVDEITDFSALQISAMYKLLAQNSKTFFGAGDLNQRLTIEGVQNIDELKWALPGVTVKNINVPYRQTKQLSEVSSALIKSEETLKQPDSIETDGVNPVIGLKICTIEQKANWIYERILEIETHLKSIEQDVSFPSIAILVNSKTDIEPLVSALNELLQNINIDVEACYENAKGTDNHVRVFCLDYIKGLEFEAAFFIDVDKIIERMPKLYDKFLYVGISRAATFLGITSEQEIFPKELNHIRKYFVEDWKEAS